jgi:hypothetical protein
MREIVSLALTVLMMTHLQPAAYCEDSVASRISAMPAGTHLEVRLKNQQKMRGTRGPVSDSGFTLVETGAVEHQIAFDNVATVKQLKSHLTRNILIGVGIGVAALGITLGILLRCGPFGCGSNGKI